MHEQLSGDPEPCPPADDPSRWLARVEDVILQLEAGIQDASLGERIECPDLQAIIGPELVERYKAIAADRVKHDPVFRVNWIRKFIEVLKNSVGAPRQLFPAIPGELEANTGATEPPVLVVPLPGGDVILRPDQVLAARRWGIWFRFRDRHLEREYVDYLVRRSCKTLASNIASLRYLEATFLSLNSKLTSVPQWPPEPRGRQFEQLMLDVLNELRGVAKSAPLAEDILERTDLRVSYPGLARNRGARMQVSLTADPALHLEKVHGLLKPKEFILLTPLELARCAVHPPTSPQFDSFPWSELWISLGGQRRDVHALANEFHDMFVEACCRLPSHPLDPMWLLPPSVRKLVRAFAEHHAIKTTHHVKDRVKQTGRWISSVRKYTRYRWIGDPPGGDSKEGSAVAEPPPNQAGKA